MKLTSLKTHIRKFPKFDINCKLFFFFINSIQLSINNSFQLSRSEKRIFYYDIFGYKNVIINIYDAWPYICSLWRHQVMHAVSSLQQKGNAKHSPSLMEALLITWTAKARSCLHREIKGCQKGMLFLTILYLF